MTIDIDSHIPTGEIFPHLFSRLDPVSKNNYRKKYKTIKKYGSVVTLTGIGAAEGTQIAKDIVSSKLKAYGYKSFFAVVSGPVIQFISIPFYVFSYGSKLRRFAVSVTEIGAKITKGEMGIVNWSWIGVDMALFGEPVSITEDSDFLIIHNETVGKLGEIIEDFVD